MSAGKPHIITCHMYCRQHIVGGVATDFSDVSKARKSLKSYVLENHIFLALNMSRPISFVIVN